MSEENKAVIRRFFEEVWNEKKINVIDEVIAADQVDHSLPPGLPGWVPVPPWYWDSL